MSNRLLHAWRTSTIVESVVVADRVKRIVLDIPGVAAAPAGSHVDVLLPLARGEVVRSYSVVDDGRYPGLVSLGVQLDPHSRGGSAYVHGLRPGQELVTSQPVQTFDLTWGRSSYTLLAGGIGVTPLVSMARQLRSWGAAYEIVYAGRSASDMAFAEDLVRDHPERVRLVRDDQEGQLDLAALVARLPEATEFYVCGPMGMLQAARRAWAANGRQPARLRFETFGSSGTAPAQEFRIRVPRLGIDTSVPPTVSAIEALEAAGAPVMADCLRGECGLCLASVLSHDEPLDHRDVFLSDRQRAAADQLCLCVSRSLGGCVTIDLP